MFSKAGELIGKEVETNELNYPSKAIQCSRPPKSSRKYSHLKSTHSACGVLSLVIIRMLCVVIAG